LIDGGAANRTTVDTYMKEAVLKKITYPSKGYTEFDFETNKYNDGSNDVFAGGLRVKNIKSYAEGKTFMKRYEYSSSAGAGIGRLTTNWTPTNAGVPSIQNLRYDDQEGTAQSVGAAIQASFTQSGGAVELNTMDAAPVYYTEVVEYFEDQTDPTKNGKNVYTFDFENDLIVNSINYQSRSVKPWRRGNLLSKATYNNANSVIATSTNSYQELKTNSQMAAAFVSAPNIYSGFEVPECTTGFKSGFPNYSYGTVDYQTGLKLLTNTTSEIDNVSTIQNTTYNDNLLVSQSQNTDSQSNSSKTESFVYPSDAAYATNAIAQNMLTRNMLNTVLEVNVNETINGSTNTIYKEKKVFDYFAGSNSRGLTNNVLTKELWLASTGGVLQKKVVFTDYATNGNPLAYLNDGMPISLVWGYNNALLIAEIKNATKSETDMGFSSAAINPNDFSIINLSTTELNKIQNLRNLLPDAQISWFAYRPQIGLGNLIAQYGLVNRFEYDVLNRLNNTKDNAGNLKSLYQYNYATTAPSTCTTPNAPSISVSSTSLCNAVLSATGCAGIINWSNGQSGSSLTLNTTNSVTITATCSIGTCTSTASNSLTLPILPTGWTSTDIGSPSTAGCTQFGASQLTISGMGYDFNLADGNKTDQFHYVYESLTGDVSLEAKISSLLAVTDKRAGIMFRSSLASNAQYFSLIQDGNGVVGFLKRSNDGVGRDFISYQNASINNTWIKIVKTGNSFVPYYKTSPTGAWSAIFNSYDFQANPTTVNFGTNFLVGFISYDDSLTGVNQATFSNISVNGAGL
jgi:hypothetical protein